MNIFIVEDSPLLAAALKQLVLKLGHSIAGMAASYDDAVNKIDTNVDMVISDIMLMGQKNGIELGAYIKSRFNIPIVYQSSITDSETIYNAMLNNPLAYLVKPVDQTQLLSVLEDAELALNKQ